MPRAALALLGLLAAATGHADVLTVGATGRTDLSLTVYAGGDRAVVRDTRKAMLPSGDAEIVFDDVPPTLDPHTVGLRVPDAPDRLRVREQTFLFDLASPDQLLSRWVGRDVELEETDAKLRTKITPATLLAAQGAVVVRIGDRIVLNPSGRLRLPPLADAVWTRPALRWRVASSRAGEAQLEATYATGGLVWTADYVAWLDARRTAMDLTALVSVTNDTSTSFPDARLAVVAGEIHRATTPEPRPMYRAAMPAMAPEMASGVAESELADYRQYTLEDHVSLDAHQTTQVPLLAARGVAVSARFVASPTAPAFRQPAREVGQDVPVRTILVVANTEQSHLGRALPAGVVRFYAPDASGAPAFVGEDRLRGLPVGATAELEAGTAFDVTARRTQTDWKKLDVQPWTAESAWSVVVRNARGDAVTVEVREPVSGEWNVLASSLPAKKLDASTLAFDVPVPARGETTLTYRVQVGR